MRALVLGGSGFFGSVTARLLAKEDCFDTILLASRSTERTTALQSEIGSKASAVAVDMLDPASLEVAAENVDLIINAAGATLKTAVPAMCAAARAGISYCDIAAEADVLLQAEAFEEEFSASKSAIVIGAGFHPGVTNLLGETAIAHLDRVDAVNYYIVGNFPDYGDPDGMLSMLEGGWQGTEGLKTIMAGLGLPATTIKEGARKDEAPWVSGHSATTPDGIPIDFTLFSTLEPIALNRVHPEIPNSAMYYGAWPVSVTPVLKKHARRFATGEISAPVALKAIFEAARQTEGDAPRVHFWAEATGKKDGRRASCTVFSTEPWATNANMIATTTGALAFTAKALATGRIEKTGLLTAADVFDANTLFEELSGGQPKIIVSMS